MISIGPYRLEGRALLAPMAGVADLPFRRLCRRYGAALAAGEMISADPRLGETAESRRRRDHSGEPGPRIVQIAGGDAGTVALAARRNVDAGAEIIDINMGCPAKKVCRKDAGSALLRDESLVADILAATVRAVTVPVTLKIRTGWSADRRNGVAIARIAEDCGISALAVHGRTRACRFTGEAEYDRATAEKSLQKFKKVSGKFGDLFPEGSDTGDTEAAPAIWEDREGFNEALQKWADATAAALETAPATLDDAKPVLGGVFNTCKNCHDTYRIDED